MIKYSGVRRSRCDRDKEVMRPCWIGTQRINITRHKLHPAEPQGHQEHVTGLNDVCCHGNAANNTGVSYERAYERQKNKKS